jgi:hypothetical protein
LEFQVSSLEQHNAAVTDETSGLVAQLRELERLREQVRKAELAWRWWQIDRRKRKRIGRLEPESRSRRPLNRSETGLFPSGHPDIRMEVAVQSQPR